MDLAGSITIGEVVEALAGLVHFCRPQKIRQQRGPAGSFIQQTKGVFTGTTRELFSRDPQNRKRKINMPREGRGPEELRSLTFKRKYTRQAPGSVLVKMGRTTVLCTCSIDETVPPFLKGTGKGWLSAEYGMLPGSTET